MPNPYAVEQYVTTEQLEDGLNDYALKPVGSQYRPIHFSETAENFTVVYELYQPKYHRE
jgi:hypothetical protein